MSATRLGVSDVHIDTFKTRSEHRGRSITVTLQGNADIDAQEHLKALLDALHVEARRLGVADTIFDLQELYFMNSSCLSLLLRHVNVVMQAPDYQLKFRVNPNLRWQKRSLQALHSYAPNLVTIE